MAILPGSIIVADDFTAEIDALQTEIDAFTITNPRVRVSKTGTQTVPRITGTALSFDHEDWDVGPMHSGSASRLISPKDNIYSGIGYAVWSTDTRGFRRIEVRANGSQLITSTKFDAEGTDPTDQVIPWRCFLSAGDYVELVAYYDAAGGSPATLDILGASFDATAEGNTS